MKKIGLALCWFMPLMLNAQIKNGIEFFKAGNWQEVVSKAKTEKKNILVDAYATWCGPCKRMDAEVYTDSKVGDFVNENLIAVKIQFDRTTHDSDSIKSWYADVEFLTEKYKIAGFPTYLFFSPEGELIDKGSGYQSAQSFLALLKQANSSQQNYAGKIQQFKSGKLNDQVLLQFALIAKENNNDSLAFQAAKIYKAKVIDKVEPSKILSPEILKYFGVFYDLLSPKDAIIQYLYKHPSDADVKMNNKGYSRSMTDYQIRKALVDPLMKPQGKYAFREPGWANLKKVIAERYDTNTASRILLNAKLDWYTEKKDWPNIVKYQIEKIDTSGVSENVFTRAAINNMVFEIIFLHSEDQAYLNKGIKLMELVLKSEPNNDVQLDTYANLLYKIGRKEEGIEQEETALQIASERKDEGRIAEYQNNLRKMRNSESTWTAEEHF